MHGAKNLTRQPTYTTYLIRFNTILKQPLNSGAAPSPRLIPRTSNSSTGQWRHGLIETVSLAHTR